MTLLYLRLHRLWLLGWLLLGVCLTARATHIVGGELELQYRGASAATTHRVNLNLYFDAINGNPGAKDATLYVGLFRKRDNFFIGFITLRRIGNQDEYIDYTKPACSISTLRTLIIRYTTDVNLLQADFSDAGGYYMTWERCCRNGTIDNLISPDGAGSTFYLEFPNAWSNGRPYANSSPVFGQAKGDYACIGKPFTFDFSAKDPDGDSLTYSLVTPYNGFSNRVNSSPGVPDPVTGLANFYPGPYPNVSWSSGFSATNAIPGPQPLRVNARTGLLSVTPSRVGLFVFSVLVEERRNGQVIGRVRRDFQLKVIDCPVNAPPVVLLRPAGQTAFYKEGTVLTINEKEQNCLTVYLTDPEANQVLSLTTIGASLPGLTLTPGQFTTRTARDTLAATVCFGRCAGGQSGQVTLQIVAADAGCPQSLQDTLTVTINIIPDQNHKPIVTTDLLPPPSRTVTVGTSLTFTATARDIDNEQVSLRAVGRGFTLTPAGMTFTGGSATSQISSVFTYKPICNLARSEPYLIDFIAFDNNCNRPLGDTTTVSLTARGLPSQPPTIQTTLPQPQTINLNIVPGDTAASSVRFTVVGDDPDRDSLSMYAVGRGFDYAALGMKFTARNGRPVLRSPFDWTATCALLQGKSEATFTLDFIDDDHSCQPNHTDTTTVIINVKSPVADYEITIPNVFTPNNDGFNDYFTVRNLPIDNCTEQFKLVEIVNRWGRRVFSSTDRNFRWYGEDFPAGEYLYSVQYTEHQYKGHVTLIR